MSTENGSNGETPGGTARPTKNRPFNLAGPGFEATKRAALIGILILLLLIPLGMIEDLVRERADRAAQVDSEITSQWGGPQTVLGPVLVVPYRYVSTFGDAAKTRTNTGTLYFLPDQLDIAASVKTEQRAKSIYRAMVYDSAAHIAGRFSGLTTARSDIPPEMIDWQDARLLVGIRDTAAIRALKLSVGGKPPLGEDGWRPDQAISSALGIRVALASADTARPLDFSIDLDLHGSGALRFAPLGATTALALKADWPHPDFSGRILPDQREISDQGFKARWSLGVLSRAYPGVWRTGEFNPETLWNAPIGAEFVEPGNVHQQTDRILKYGILVIALTFAAIFVNGLMSRRPVHAVQYLLVGAALCLFYLLLLSLAEQVAFGAAYLIASLADIALIAWYAWRTMSRRLGYVTAALLAAIQAYMYVLLQMEDYALLSGTVALFLALLGAMVATRNVDWYRVGRPPLQGTGRQPA